MKALSIRARLTAWYSLILALSLGVFGGFAYFAMHRSIRVAVDAGLRQRLEGLRVIIAKSAPQGEAELKDELSEFDAGQGGGGRVRVADRTGRELYASPGMESSSAADQGASGFTPFNKKFHGAKFRVVRDTIEVSGNRYPVEVAVYTEDFDRAIDGFRMVMYSIAPLFLVLATLGGYWMSRRALAPVDEIISASRRIGVRSLAERIAVPRTGDELERLAGTLNDMLERLDASVRRMVQFTADASHELRTPVSVIGTSAEITLRKPRSETEYRDALSQILHETEKLSHLIDQLLEMARADSGVSALKLVRTNLNKTLEKACLQARVLAAAKQLTTAERLPDEPLWVAGDPVALERLFLIFLDNAVKYTPPGGRIDVQLTSRDGMGIAEIRDTGVGIAKEDISHIFERFYQADRSRSPENGGSGLGLAIARWIAQSHGGDIGVESAISKGSSFRIQLPLAR
jgi:heavy metal sensor kinase